MRKLKVIVGIDKSNLLKNNKRIVACGKNFENVIQSSHVSRITVVVPPALKSLITAPL